MEFIELEKIYRQKDSKFIDILNAFRNKTVNESHLDILNKQVVGKDCDINDGQMYLAGTNAIADRINTQKLDSLSSDPVRYEALVS